MTDGTDAAPPPPPPPPPPGDAPPTTAPGGPTGPGWHPDPSGRPGLQRYWDGTKWTDHTHSTSPTAGAQAPQLKLPLIFRVWSWGCLGLTVIGIIILIVIFSFFQSMFHGLTHPNTGKTFNPNDEHISSSPGPRPTGLLDASTKLSFPYPGGHWRQATARIPFSAMIVADPYDADGYHGLFASGGPVSGTDLKTFTETQGATLRPRLHGGSAAVEAEVKNEAATVTGHPAWQIEWHIPAAADNPASTDWLLAVDTGAPGPDNVGRNFVYVYGTIDNGVSDLSPSVFDQVLRTIQIQPN